MAGSTREGRSVRAAFHVGRETLVVRQAELPALGPGDVVVGVEACGVCATNLHAWSAEPAGPGVLPGAHGHEIAGRVIEVGPGVTAYRPGDRVCVDPAAACGCGACPACLAGDPMLCRAQTLLPVWGFADALAVPERGLVRLPSGLAPTVACLAEPLASAVHGLRHCHRAGADGRIDGESVVVLGGGCLGLLTVHAAHCLGASEVVAVVRHPHQARRAEALGADTVVGSDDPGVTAVLRRLRAGIVVEAVGGTAATLEQAFTVVDRGGEVVVLGLFAEPRAIDVTAAVLRNVRAFFAAAYATRDGTADIAVAVAMLAAQPALGSLVTQTFELEEIADARRAALCRARGVGRVVVVP
jgi:L-iditol 2-dehydrogenase